MKKLIVFILMTLPFSVCGQLIDTDKRFENKIVREYKFKKFVDKLLPIPLEFKGHDNWIVNIADDLDKRYIDSKVLQYYRRHGDNESHAQSSMIRDITWKDKLTLLSIRVKRKFDFHVWIEYSIKQKLLKQKIQEIKNEN